MSKIIDEGVVGVNKVLKDQKVRRSFPFIRFLISLESQLLQGEQQKKVLADLGHGKIAQSQVDGE